MFAKNTVAVFACLMFVSVSAGLAEDDSQAVTARVDQLLEQAWTSADVTPAARTTDAQFLRRAYIDLTGRIPAVNQVRTFLDSDESDKRRRLIDVLLEKPNHATHLTNVWRDVMLPRSNNNLRRFGQTGVFDNWLRGHFADDDPYDEVVRELLTVTGNQAQSGPVLYYTALEVKPEELAASTSRIFLGVQIQCAQCHDHPFDHWTQKDFWGYAAFFAKLSRGPRGNVQITENAATELKLPNTDTVVLPQFLGGKPAPTDSGTKRREQLADWLTSPENPYFARATVNRVWALLFGYGLVDPVDDFGSHNPPSQPKVLDALAADFTSHGFRLKRLFRILANTRAYQLSSGIAPGESVADSTLFSRMAVKSLTAAQIYDCLAEATRKRETDMTTGRQFGFNNRFNQQKQIFLAKFEAPTQGATEFQAGIPQVLTMMNGSLIAQSTDLSDSSLLVSLIDFPLFSNAERVEILFLTTLSRKPSQAERDRFLSYVESGGPTKDSNKALSDVLWALLNSTEFILNH